MKAKYDNLCIITESLANLYEDGIPITMSFELLLDLPLTKEYKKSLKDINYRVLRGNSLSDGFKKYEKLYPNFFVNIVSLGEESGTLVKCLKSLSKFYNTKNKFKKDMRDKLRYPCFTLVILFVVIMILFFFIVPNLYEAFISITNNVPKFIEFIYGSSKWIINNIHITSVALICWNIALYFIFKLVKENIDFSSIILRINFVKKYYEYIFILLLATILNSGIHISEGMQIMIKSMEEGYLKKYLIKIKEKVMNGEELNESIKDISFISKYTHSMINLGEKTGELVCILSKVEKRLNKNIESNLKVMASSIVPIAIVFISTIILFLFVIFVMPLLDMMYSGMSI